jgi:hypothetical protein
MVLNTFITLWLILKNHNDSLKIKKFNSLISSNFEALFENIWYFEKYKNEIDHWNELKKNLVSLNMWTKILTLI